MPHLDERSVPNVNQVDSVPTVNYLGEFVRKGGLWRVWISVFCHMGYESPAKDLAATCQIG